MSNVERFKQKAALSNSTIDMNNKFIGFDRRQTHNSALQKANVNRNKTVMTKTMDNAKLNQMLSEPRLAGHPTLMNKRDNILLETASGLKKHPMAKETPKSPK